MFSEHTCHELNFFLYKRDKDFFNKIVKELIKNKLEKTFMDHYLLGIDGDQNAPTVHDRFVLTHIDHIYKLDKINALEKSLLIQYCLLKGT